MQAVAFMETMMTELKKDYPPPPPGYRRVFSRTITRKGKVIPHPRGGLYTWLVPTDTVI